MQAMTTREENKQLKGQIEILKTQNQFLSKKIEKQAQELLKAAKDKGALSTLRKKNNILKDENVKLQEALSEYERQGSKVIDIQKRQMQNRIRELEKSQLELREERLRNTDKISTLEYELKQTQAFMVHLPPYGDIPQEFYDYAKSLEQQLQIARSNYAAAKDRLNVLLKYLADEEQNTHVQEYLDTYFQKRRGARRKISDEKIKTIKELREGGMSIRDISSVTGASVGSVHRYLKEK